MKNSRPLSLAAPRLAMRGRGVLARLGKRQQRHNAGTGEDCVLRLDLLLARHPQLTLLRLRRIHAADSQAQDSWRRQMTSFS